jgi:hypothetical protein
VQKEGIEEKKKKKKTKKKKEKEKKRFFRRKADLFSRRDTYDCFFFHQDCACRPFVVRGFRARRLCPSASDWESSSSGMRSRLL